MEKVDQDYLDAIISSQNNKGTTNYTECPFSDPMAIYENVQKEAVNLGKGNTGLDMEIIMQFLQVILFLIWFFPLLILI